MAPNEVHVKKAADLSESTGQTGGMTRKGAITDKASICATVMIAEAHSTSDVHHHGSQDTIVYCVRGHGAIISEGGEKRQSLAPGDFALIPAYAEHQEVNNGDEELEWIITRSGPVPAVENLGGWGHS